MCIFIYNFVTNNIFSNLIYTCTKTKRKPKALNVDLLRFTKNGEREHCTYFEDKVFALSVHRIV